MGQLNLAFFGVPRVTHDGTILTFTTRKVLALLAYLAVERGQQSRDSVIALLWPDADEAHGRGNLRWTLTHLRRALQPDANEHLLGSAERLELAPTFTDDLTSVHEAWAVARASGPTPIPQLVERLSEANQHYRGEFLEGLSLGDAPEFDEWLAVQREAWHRRIVIVFDRLTRLLSEGGDLVEAIESSLRWVAIDRANETAHRRLIRLYLTAGDRGAALDAFETCRATLARELGAEPGPETLALVARARAGKPRRGQESRGRAAIPMVTVEAPLVGRLEEHSRLVAAFSESRRLGARGIVIEGESGIGKSRLVADFLAWAQAQGADVLQGRAIETVGSLPYYTIVEALRARLSDEGDLAGLLDDVWLVELGRLLPELHDRQVSRGTSSTDDADAPTRVSEAVTRLVGAFARKAPVVVFVDDLQWTDGASLDLLRYASRGWVKGSSPILIVTAVRSEDLASDERLRSWLTTLGRELPLERILLGPLSLGDVGRLVEALDLNADEASSTVSTVVPSSDPAPALASWLFQETKGYPFFVTETVKSLYERGTLGLDRNGRLRVDAQIRYDRDLGLGTFIPTRVADVIRARLARLNPSARAIVTTASVLDHHFTFDQLCAVSGIVVDDALPAIDDVVARRILRDRDTTYDFVHDKIREIAYADAGSARRLVLHRRALEALERTGAAPGELLYHARAANMPDATRRLEIASGDEALRLFAVREAIEHYERALGLGPGEAPATLDRSVSIQADRSELDKPARTHVYAQFGRACELVGDFLRAKTLHEALRATALANGDSRLECVALNRLATVAAIASLDLTTAIEYLIQARRIAEASGDRVGLAETLWNLAQTEMYRGNLVTSEAESQRAIALAREIDRPDYLARALNGLSYCELFANKLPSGAEHAAEARSLYAALGNRAMEADSLAHYCHIKNCDGAPAEGLAAAREAFRISRDIENHWGQTNAAAMMASSLVDLGEYEDAIAHGRQAESTSRSGTFGPLRVMVLVGLGSGYRGIFALDEARRLHLEARDVAIEFSRIAGHRLFVEMAASELCADCVAADDWIQAASWAREVLASRAYSTLTAGLHRWCVVDSLLRAGDDQVAVEDLRRFGEGIGTNRRFRIPFLRAQAILATWHNDLTSALAHLEAASLLAAELRLPGELWAIDSNIADLHRHMGNLSAATAARAAAATTIRNLASRIGDPALRSSFLAGAPIRRNLESSN